ncbi:UNVERIFIED_CONTAM: hypothetical protein PYX00_010536 [Menopon gallinae]|uniref:Uncharacterized protein n=1 Tax=Menopon gallinae TaxID=328185 RepID=A0AAW2HG51_9NEOP
MAFGFGPINPFGLSRTRVSTRRSGGRCSKSRPKKPEVVSSCLPSLYSVVILVCLETVLLSTGSNCTKSFYVHWNTTNPM